MKHFLKYFLIGLGVGLIVFIRGHMLIQNPHLTEAEALGRYFWLWAIALIAAIAGAWL